MGSLSDLSHLQHPSAVPVNTAAARAHWRRKFDKSRLTRNPFTKSFSKLTAPNWWYVLTCLLSFFLSFSYKCVYLVNVMVRYVGLRSVILLLPLFFYARICLLNLPSQPALWCDSASCWERRQDQVAISIFPKCCRLPWQHSYVEVNAF